MKAAYIDSVGPPENIQFGDVPDPKIGAHDVLVKTRAVAVNPIDTYVRSGAVPMELPMPFVVGCDVAGEVAAVGKEVARFKVGDRVWGSNQGLLGRQGTFAQQCAIDQQWLYPIPDSVDYVTAAASALVGITAHLGLFDRAKLQRGETLFVRGGSGGVGSIVIQMAKAAGAKVVATAGSDEKAEACRDLGADAVINYKRQDVLQAAQDAVGGVDVFWDAVRTPDFDLAINLMNDNGRMVVMAGRDARPEFPVGPFYVKQCTITGFVMFKAPAEAQRHAAEELNTWLAEGAIKPLVAHELPLSDAARAHQLQERSTLHGSGDAPGKIVLHVG